MILAISVVTLANGFVLPLSFAGGVTSFPDNAGAASGLMGAMHMIAGSLAIYLVAELPGTVAALAGFVSAVAAIGCVAFPLLLRWSRMPRPAPKIPCAVKTTA
jgi:DHA1 family bicyclomycin/chloramphenicol resistance-like MFS transporter